MTQPAPVGYPENVGRVSQIITAALIGGVICFSIAAYFMTNEGEARFPIVSMVAAGVAGVNATLQFVVPQIMVSSQTAKLSGKAEPELSQGLAALYQSKLIVGMALLEGAALFNLVAYMSDGQVWTFGVVAALLAIMAIRFPSQGKFEEWATDLKRDL